MVNVSIPVHLFNEMSDEEISDICFRSFKEKEFNKVSEKRARNTGQYIKLKKDGLLKYICLSRNDCTQSRNSFIIQNIPTAFQKFLEESYKNKEFEFYIRDFSAPHPPFAIYAYKLLLTSKIKILNLDLVVPSDNAGYLDHRTSFTDYKQMRKYRLESSKRNTSNTSTIFEEKEDEFSVYGKTYGANGRETTLICMALYHLVNKKIVVYNVNETSEKHQASVDPANKYILNYYGIEIDENAINFDPKNEKEQADRDSRKFHINLFKKYKDKKCYFCGCDIENLIIGAHIHRVTDIKNSNLSETVKQDQIVDADNGFWLCANHDKLFEFGLIYFNKNEMCVSDELNKKQQEFILNITADNLNLNKKYKLIPEKDKELENIILYKNNKFYINQQHYNSKMEYYLSEHKNRTQKNANIY